MMFGSETLVTPAADMTNLQNIVVAIITAASLIAVAYLQFVYKAGKKRGQDAQEANALFMEQWKTNKQDHDYVVSMIDNVGNSLGRSIDRVEANMHRNHEVVVEMYKKLDTHIRDHATGQLK